jgi:co-chaperonin GroES (HSP10)
MKNIEISKGRVLLEGLDIDNKTSGGIILTNQQDYPKRAIVRGVYEGHVEEKWLKEGDYVMYDKSHVLEIMHEGKKYLLSNLDYIYCKYKNEETNK